MRCYICPECKQKTGVKIVYGHPGDKMRQQAERGEIALVGGCELLGAPQKECLSCEHHSTTLRRGLSKAIEVGSGC